MSRKVTGTHDARSKPAKGFKARLALIGASVATLAALASQSKTIVDFIRGIFPAEDVRVGWLTVQDPGALKRCVIDKGGIFEIQAGQPLTVQLAQTPCLEQLKTHLPDPATTHMNLQKVGAIRFLLIENRGDDIEKLTLLTAASGAATGTSVFRSMPKGAAYAVCVGFEGRSGHPSAAYPIHPS